MGFLPAQMDGKQKVMLAAALVVLAVGGYMIYSNLFASSPASTPVQAVSQSNTNGPVPTGSSGQGAPVQQPPNRRTVTK